MQAAKLDKSLFPFTSKWMDVDGIPIHYIDEGSGRPLLLLHGNFMWSFSYRRLIQRLANSYRCISIDLPGFGLSGKPHQLGKAKFGYTYREQSEVLVSVIEELDLQDISFLSFDHGGPIGLGALVKIPQRYQRLVIANSWAWSCHDYRASNIWSNLAPRSLTLLRYLLLSKKRWLFESPKDLNDEESGKRAPCPINQGAIFYQQPYLLLNSPKHENTSMP